MLSFSTCHSLEPKLLFLDSYWDLPFLVYVFDVGLTIDLLYVFCRSAHVVQVAGRTPFLCVFACACQNMCMCVCVSECKHQRIPGKMTSLVFARHGHILEFIPCFGASFSYVSFQEKPVALESKAEEV